MKTQILLPLLFVVACSPAKVPASAAPLQSIADDELARVMRDTNARGATVVIVSPTGDVLADAHQNLQNAYVTGSTLKSIVLAGALEDGTVKPDESFDLEQGSFACADKRMTDASKNGVVTVPEMLQVSSNVGFTKIFDRMGGPRLEHWLKAFAFEPPTPIVDHSFDGAVVAIGEGMPATPAQVAKAYATIANGGNGVIKPETARTMTTMLESVVEHGTGKAAKVEGVKVAGKTGTASFQLPDGVVGTYASFVGFVPADHPRFVILVGVDRPKDEHASGGTVAAPAFARVATRALKTRSAE
jgi:cell division protein FtsI (penicillin-binding protein 3)